jgi:hypothetical protein
MVLIFRMSLLVYSDRCNHCMEIIEFIQANPALKPLVRYHNVNQRGVPSKQIKRVPSLVTPENNILVGGEVKNWLVSMMPCNFSQFEGAGIGMSNLDNSEPDNFFSLERYGSSLKPEISKELQERIDANVSEVYNNLKK